MVSFPASTLLFMQKHFNLCTLNGNNVVVQKMEKRIKGNAEYELISHANYIALELHFQRPYGLQCIQIFDINELIQGQLATTGKNLLSFSPLSEQFPECS